MPRDGMKILLSTFTFDNPEECKEKCSYDYFADARRIFEIFDSNRLNYLLLSLYLSMDKTQYPSANTILQNHADMSYYLIRWTMTLILTKPERLKRGRIIVHQFNTKSCSLFSQPN